MHGERAQSAVVADNITVLGAEIAPSDCEPFVAEHRFNRTTKHGSNPALFGFEFSLIFNNYHHKREFVYY